MTMIDPTDATRLARPRAHFSTVYIHVDDAGLLDVDRADGRDYVTLGIDRAVALFFDDPLALAARLHDLAAALEAMTESEAAA